MERFLRALVVVHGHFTDSFSLAPVDKPSRATVFFRIWLKPGTESQFVEIAQIESVKTPPKVEFGYMLETDEDRK